jgi:hypothetical protein
METSDYTIKNTYFTSDIKHDDYILHNNTVYKIHLIKYQSCRNVKTSITYKCRDFLETKNEFLNFPLSENVDEHIKFKKEISKIIFTIKNGTFVDYNNSEEIFSFLDDDCFLIEIKCNKNTRKCITIDNDCQIKYIKYNEDYKINIK